MLNITSRVRAWVGRRLLARATRDGFDLSKVAMVPDHLLMPLKRDGVDPVPELGEVRDREPISKLSLPFDLNAWLVTGHAEARAVLTKSASYSTDIRHLLGQAAKDETGGLGFTDPPDHTRLRKILTPEFTMRRISRLRPTIQGIVDDRLDLLEKAGPGADLATIFAFPIPFLVICELLGIGEEGRDEFQQLGTARFDVSKGGPGAFGAIAESRSFIRTAVKEQRANPGDGLLGMIIRDHGDAIDDEELAGLADGVFTGGYETTAAMLALGTMVLLRDRANYEAMRTADDDAVHRTVEELLRYLAVVQVAFPRFAKEDLEVGGESIAAGDVVLVSLSGANRDGTLGTDMDGFDPTRQPTPHFTFGHGIHRCIGAELARMELRAAYPSLSRRFPDLRLAVPPEELEFRKHSLVYGIESLPVTWGD
ncbi:cytochrome P450 [Solicola gregarius]|uniref:Cytochrome P450 n=1 Tax=Solicola gregarius TaxID=2908642 RepID=A0AA46TJW1_9ACTN|nr:cytochrome P450 [Solicola gregarius]UYM06440.1 cytochrome P450 [Solicola gregarius]